MVEAGGPFPDLLVVDGGKGQLNAAYAALGASGLSNLVAVGLAKKEELVFTRDRDQPMALDRTARRCCLLQRIRDEAHRFAVTFHRKSRARCATSRSELDAIPGVGARRRKTLLTPLRQRRRRSPGDPRGAGPLVGPQRRRRDPRALRHGSRRATV